MMDQLNSQQTVADRFEAHCVVQNGFSREQTRDLAATMRSRLLGNNRIASSGGDDETTKRTPPPPGAPVPK